MKIKTWQERCEEHPDHEGIVTEDMIQERMQEEIDDLREALESLSTKGYRQCAKGQRTTQYCGLLEDAVKAEREACAAMAEAFHHHQYDFTGDLELHEAIRARSKT